MKLAPLVGGQLSDFVGRGSRIEVPGTDPGFIKTNEYGQGTTGDSGTNTKGTWGEVFAALTDDVYGIYVNAHNTEVNDRDYLWDIGIGAAGSEVVLIADLCSSVTGSNKYAMQTYYIPIYIKRGTRVAVRCQANINLLTISPFLYFHNYPVLAPLIRSCETLGANTAASRGQTVDPGGTAFTKGAYTQIIASTAKRIRHIMFGFPNRTNAGRVDANWLLDIATGAGGAESIFLTDIRITNENFHNVFHPGFVGPFPVDIPAGTRLAARASCSTADATDRLIDIIGYGYRTT